MPAEAAGYVGRFAPSPTGPLHAGSLVAALASWLDARAHRGRWLVRIEDTDTPRCVAGADREILGQLGACGLHPDAPPLWQSTRSGAYRAALERLQTAGWAFGCACSRSHVLAALEARGRVRLRHGELVYPGTCRGGLRGRPARAFRALAAARTEPPYSELIVEWSDRRLGAQRQNVSTEVGDFVLRRADGLWAYQLAVVVDDAEQGVTHVVRGEDLADNTPRQIHLQHGLGLPTPAYLHTPLVLGADGEKLSKRNGATALDVRDPVATVRTALGVLDVPAVGTTLAALLESAVRAWPARLASWSPLF
jgi:glutamyl-Q tRNA(Asp) synthetase